jgi:hypothetical protein
MEIPEEVSHMTRAKKRSLITFFAVSCVIPLARAADPPADLCSLLSAAQVSKALGQTFNSPTKSVAPRPYRNTAEGTDCTYSTKGGDQVLFRAYVDLSPSDAKELFGRLKILYSPPVQVPELGDEAYFDPRHAIHVRKGKVRFFLSFNDEPTAEKPLKELASQVAARL